MKLFFVSFSFIVSSEQGVNFYKELGFEEISRETRKEMHDEIILLSNGQLELKIYKDPTHPVRNRKPESLGIRYLTFETDEFDSFKDFDMRKDNIGRFVFINDPDGQPVQIREKK